METLYLITHHRPFFLKPEMKSSLLFLTVISWSSTILDRSIHRSHAVSFCQLIWFDLFWYIGDCYAIDKHSVIVLKILHSVILFKIFKNMSNVLFFKCPHVSRCLLNVILKNKTYVESLMFVLIYWIRPAHLNPTILQLEKD